MTIQMERFRFKTVPWLPWVTCDVCPLHVTFPNPALAEEIPSAADMGGHVLWATNGLGAPVGASTSVFFACSDSCAAAIRKRAGVSDIASISWAEFLALLMLKPEHRALVDAAIERIGARGSLERTVRDVQVQGEES